MSKPLLRTHGMQRDVPTGGQPRARNPHYSVQRHETISTKSSNVCCKGRLPHTRNNCKPLISMLTTVHSSPTHCVGDATGPVYRSERADLPANAASEVATTRLEHFRNALSINAEPAGCDLILAGNTSKPLDSCRTLLNTCEAPEHNVRSVFAADD